MEWKRQLGGGFKQVLFSPLFGEDSPISDGLVQLPTSQGFWNLGTPCEQPLATGNQFDRFAALLSLKTQNPGWDVILSCEKLGRATVTVTAVWTVFKRWWSVASGEFWCMMFNKNPTLIFWCEIIAFEIINRMNWVNLPLADLVHFGALFYFSETTGFVIAYVRDRMGQQTF